MNIRDENVLREMNLYPLWVRRDTPAEIETQPVEVINSSSEVAGRDLSRQAQVESDNSVGMNPDLQNRSSATGGLGEQLDWHSLKQQVKSCTACKLRAGCTQTVFGVGDEKAEWLFVGEGPGADEDAQGEPFVGQAGKLLDNMLAAIKLKRGNNVYIANIVKCRPPNNRTPEPDEIATCLPYLQRQIALIQPRLIVALGKTAANALMGKDATLGSLRGKLHDYHGSPLLITYHPAYLLRSPMEKARAWEDLQRAVNTMCELKGQTTLE